jgi:hypothetical protein
MGADERKLDQLKEAAATVRDLHRSLRGLHARDPDQEISEYAYRPVDRALRLAADLVGDNEVVAEIRELFSPEQAASGRDIRVAEVLPVVTMLLGILDRRARREALSQPGATHPRRAGGC